MRRSIVPKGFEKCSHSVFHNYSNPLLPPINFNDNEMDENVEKEKNENINTCPICLQEVLDPVTLVSCHHYFCIECIVKWFQTKLACPLCKTTCSYFIQSNLGNQGQFNLWKIAPYMNENETKHTLDASSSLPGLQMAIRAHRSNVLLRKFIIPLNYSNDNNESILTTESREGVSIRKSTEATSSIDISRTTITRTDNRADFMSLPSTAKKSAISHPHSDDINVSIGLSDSDDLEAICLELKRLEDELEANYDKEDNDP